MIHCVCVERHVPLPMTERSLQVGQDVVGLCPTTYYNVMDLLVEFKIVDGLPPGRVTKHYSKYVREICLRIWKDQHPMS